MSRTVIRCRPDSFVSETPLRVITPLTIGVFSLAREHSNYGKLLRGLQGFNLQSPEMAICLTEIVVVCAMFRMKPHGLLLAALVFITGCGTGFMGLETVQQYYAGYSTPQLKLKYRQISEDVGRDDSKSEFRFGTPLGMAMAGDGGKSDRIKEKHNIESELLRRYTDGDQQAYLPIFGDIQPGTNGTNTASVAQPHVSPTTPKDSR